MNKTCTNLASVRILFQSLKLDIDNANKPNTSSLIVHLLLCRVRFRSEISTLMIIILSMILLFSLIPYEAQASAGSYQIQMFAADPELNNGPFLPTYEKLTPDFLTSPGTAGRYSDPLPNAVCYATQSKIDGVNTLNPKNMVLGQIVPFEISIDVKGDTAPENGIMKFNTSFSTNTTSGANFSIDPDYMIYAAFVDTADPGSIDPRNNARLDNYTSMLTGSGSSQNIEGTFQVSGLDNGDRVIVEIWVVLKSTIPESTTGNVQIKMLDAKTAAGDKINVGTQTVNVQKLSEFITDDADISIVKTDSPDPVIQGQNIIYTLTIKDNSVDTTAGGIIVTDTLPSNLNFVSCNVSSYTLNGNNITINVGSLSPNQSKMITIITKVNKTAPANNDTSTNSEIGTSGSEPVLYDLLNKVSETSITADSNTLNNVYYQPTNVLLVDPYLPKANFSSNVTNGSTPLSVQFYDNSINATSLIWDFGDGANSTQQNPLHTFSSAGNYTVNLTVSNTYGIDSYLAVINVTENTPIGTGNNTNNVSTSTPYINWSNPANIIFGTALSGIQLNAFSPVPGSFVYIPGSGTILGSGISFLHVDFTPIDPVNYSNTSKNVRIFVTKATPTIIWNAPAAITYGTALSSTQLDATSPIAGNFVYSPDNGTVLSAGTQTLFCTFTPYDTKNYTTNTASVSLTVNKATPEITWSNPADIIYGTALNDIQLDASSQLPGIFTYYPASGTVLSAGNYTLHVDFTPDDFVNYTDTSKDVIITVNEYLNISIAKRIKNQEATDRYNITLSLKSNMQSGESNVRVYDLVPENFTITDPVPDFNGSLGNIYYWSVSLAAGESKTVTYTLTGTGSYSLRKTFIVGVDPQ